MLIVLGTRFFHHRFLYPPETLNRQPRLIESVWIVHSDVHFQHLAAVDQPPPLDDVKLLAMRRAVIVDEGLGVLTDRIDYQRRLRKWPTDSPYQDGVRCSEWGTSR